MKKSVLIILLFLFIERLQSQSGIIPAPVKEQPGVGTFVLSAKTQLVLNDDGEKVAANFLNDYLQRFYGFKLLVAKQATENFIRLNTLRFIKAPENEGHYQLAVTPASIQIDGDTYAGTFYGMQTLLQLLPPEPKKQLSIASVSIDDYPRFAYRGMHLDVARHFFTVEFVKKYIDYLALHKMNTFHWHLTDDQGWRIEIKKYPRLTSVGGYRNGTIIGRYPGKGNTNKKYGGFYSQNEIKEVVKYAADRYITVIPEIDIPGHSSAAIAAYPELSCFPGEDTKHPAQTAWSGTTSGKQLQQTWGVFPDVLCPTEYTFNFFQHVFDEVMELFPSQYIHIGGDECPKDAWKRSDFCQKLIKEKDLKNEMELQSYFTQRIEEYINSKGRKVIGWDEILEGGIAPNATIMSWQGEKGGIEAAKQKHAAIMTPGGYCYFDHAQTKNEDSVVIGNYLPLEKVYGYEPIPKQLNSEEAKYILGAQGNLWTEYITNPSKVEYMAFPRMSALSEVLWSPKEKRNWSDFESRLLTQFTRYDFWRTNYSKAYFEIKDSVAAAPANKGLLWYLSTNFKGGKIAADLQPANPSGKSANSIPRLSAQMGSPVQISNSGVAIASLSYNGNPQFKTLSRKFLINKATGKNVTLTAPPSGTYPGNVGAFGLVNGLVSEHDFLSREWLGWLAKDMEAVIDLGMEEFISKVSVDVWKQEPSFIYLPKSMEVYTSMNGKTWGNYVASVPSNNKWANERTLTVSFKKQVNARFVKVILKNNGVIAEGMPGAGRNAWLFADEIMVE